MVGEARGAAYAEALSHDITAFDDDILTALISNATIDDRLDVVDQVVASLGETFLDKRPVLAARDCVGSR